MTTSFLHRTRNALLIIFTFMLMVLVSAFAYSAWLEKPYLSYKNLPFPVMSAASPGDRVILRVMRCSSEKTVQSYRTTHGLRNEATRQMVVLPSIEVTVDPGCHTDDSKINVVPEDTPDGYYSFFGIAQVRGLMTTQEVGWNSETFKVTKKPTP